MDESTYWRSSTEGSALVLYTRLKKLDSAGSINIYLCMVVFSGKATVRGWGKERVDDVLWFYFNENYLKERHIISGGREMAK